MAKKRGITMYLEYYAFRIVFMVFRAMSIEAALAVARGISPIVYLLHARHRRVAIDNLRQAFGDEMSEREVRRIARGVYAHMVMVGVEVLKMPDILKRDTVGRYIQFENEHIVDALIASGSGAIFVTGHFGNWEINSYLMYLMGHPLHTVARPLDNPLLDEYVKKHRADMGRQVEDKRGALRGFMRTLKEGKFLGMIVDQDARDKGIFVEFFGRKCSWYPTPAVLALRFNVPVVPGFCYRRGHRFRFTVIAEDPIYPVRTGNEEQDVHRIVQAYAKKFEEHIRRRPEQWLWNHRRWKTRPPEELEAQQAEKGRV
ncbi:MAG: lysophospholipid acyltransferase family protein [Planctomycetes bacterium]|nr:lysophospholipid acyltransferase family protein [Planctomycetota bacterium]